MRRPTIIYPIQRVKRRDLSNKHIDFLNGDKEHIYYYSSDSSPYMPASLWSYSYLTKEEFDKSTIIADGQLVTKIVDDYQVGFIERQLCIEHDGIGYLLPDCGLPMKMFQNQYLIKSDDELQIELERLMDGQPEFTFHTLSNNEK